MHSNDLVLRQNLLRVLNPLQLNFFLLVVQIVRQSTEGTLTEQQINVLERFLLRFLERSATIIYVLDRKNLPCRKRKQPVV
jgi:hypothetical protein